MTSLKIIYAVRTMSKNIEGTSVQKWQGG